MMERHRGASIAVVGATCPLGRHLVPALLAIGHHVRCVAREPSRMSTRWRKDPRCEIATTLGDVRTVVWLAHLRHIDPREEVAANVRILKAACRRERRLVFISSGGSVYGEPQQIPVPEDHPRRPLSAYGMAKCAMEDVVAAAAHRAGSGAILRPGNIYGPEYLKADGRGAAAVFTRSLLAEQPIPLRDGGRGARDFVHVDDVVRAIVAAVRWRRGGLAVWNVGTGVATATRDVLKEVSDILGRKPVAVLSEPREASDVSAIALSSTLIESECGWRPTYALKTGLRRVLEHVSADQLLCDRGGASLRGFSRETIRGLA